MPHVRSLPENASLQDLRRTYSGLFDLMRPYAQQLMRGPSPLSEGERELIAAYTSGLNSCRYCHGVHSRVACQFGIDEGLFEALLTNLDEAPVERRLKPLLIFARKLTEAPSRLIAEDSAAVYEAGWSEEALVHTVAVCAYFNQMNRLVEGAGIVGEGTGYEAAAGQLATNGYMR